MLRLPSCFILLTSLGLATLFPAFLKAAETLPYQWETKGIQLRFPAKPTTTTNGDHTLVDYSRGATSMGLSLYDARWDGTRGEIFERYKLGLLKGFKGSLVEYSSVRWRGHYGHEWTFAYAAPSGQMILERHRDLVMHDRTLFLFHRVHLFGDELTMDFVRNYERGEAYGFFDSLSLNPAGKVLEKPEPEELDGRWVVMSEGGKRPDNPQELAFMGGTYLSGNQGNWCTPLGGIGLKGTYEVDTEPQPKTITVTLNFGGEQRFLFEIDGETLKLQPVESFPATFEASKAWVLRRPGDTPEDLKPANNKQVAEKRKKSSAKKPTPKSSPAFPRTDGVYAVESQILVGTQPRLVMDYLVFSEEQRVYFIKGGLHPSGERALEQPSGDGDGTFFLLRAPLTTQPERIRKWLSDPQEPRPDSGTYTVVEGEVQFEIDVPRADEQGFTWTYRGVETEGDILMKEHSSHRGKTTVTYRFLPFDPPK